MLDALEIETAPNPSAAVIWLHGLGAEGGDFVPVVRELKLGAAPAVRFIFPHAPVRPITLNNGYAMRAWYDIRRGDLEGSSREADSAGLRESRLAIEALIAHEAGRGIAPRRIVLAGFSQGGVVALHCGLRHGARLAGVLALSTYLPLAAVLLAEASAANRETPIFLAHGTSDGVIPLSAASAARNLLSGAGYAVEWHEYPMQHSVCPREIADIAAWLQKVLEMPPAAAAPGGKAAE